MKVILREDVKDVGQAGQVVEVKSGYGRNFLIPRNLAIAATEANVRAIDEVKKQKTIREKKQRREAEIIKDKIEQLSISVPMLVGEDDKIFGSVTSHDLAELMEKDGLKVDRRMIQLVEPLKSLGVYTVPVKVDKDVVANLKVWVIKKT
ncbi:MAG: 50S ribosomal protein L9 [candidate division Zixibacteria bacterium]|nr:50S ribosomal protein L9 [candidate division Zixibacteria bacterium]MDD5426644.1 50S ribosomal protein L9 [candidate division Zixibacteria bacterium]